MTNENEFLPLDQSASSADNPMLNKFMELDPRVQKSIVDLEKSKHALGIEQAKLAIETASIFKLVVEGAVDTRKTNNAIELIREKTENRIKEMKIKSNLDLQELLLKLKPLDRKYDMIEHIISYIGKKELSDFDKSVILNIIETLKDK